MYRLAFFLAFPFALFAQQLIATFTIDTSLYTSTPITVAQDPVNYHWGDYCAAYRKKNSDQVDLFNFKGKVASITVPFSTIPSSSSLYMTYVSQTFIDNDSGWESSISYYNTTGTDITYNFKLFDDNGTVLLSDVGFASLVYDGKNTYVCAATNSGLRKAWQFRINIAAAFPALQKQSVLEQPSISFNPSGVFRVALNKTANGETTIQLFNLLGQAFYLQTIPANMSNFNFTIPSIGIPASPFITKISNENGDYTQKFIPVK